MLFGKMHGKNKNLAAYPSICLQSEHNRAMISIYSGSVR